MSLIVAAIEDSQVVLDHLSHIFKGDSRIKQFYAAKNRGEAVQLIHNQSIDVFLLDLGLPDVDGQELIPVIQERQPESKIIVLTTISSSRHVMDVLQRGANGYLLKHEVNIGIIDKIIQTVSGNSPLSPEVSRILIQKIQDNAKRDSGVDVSKKLAHFDISDKEAQVLNYIAQGLSISTIATRINKSTHTVNLHLRSIYRKLGVHSRGAAVHVAIAEGLIPTP